MMQHYAATERDGGQMASKSRVTVNLSGAEYKELSAIAGKLRVSMAWVGRQALLEYIERARQDGLQLPLGLPAKKSQGPSHD